MQLLGREPRAGISDHERHLVAILTQFHPDASGAGVLDGVGEELVHDEAQGDGEVDGDLDPVGLEGDGRGHGEAAPNPADRKNRAPFQGKASQHPL